LVKPGNEIPTLPSSEKYDWVKPDIEITTLPSSQKYDWIKPDNEIPPSPLVRSMTGLNLTMRSHPPL
jgi:hypothetical protein